MTFESARPEKMILELSRDYGNTWEVVQYYDISCTGAEYAGIPNVVTVADPTAVICTKNYSKVVSKYTDFQIYAPHMIQMCVRCRNI